ncbi:MAG: hypothetical protein JMN24_04170 [gamma proteobacterium endosymbiont of Lamellibrachia anaximandri]|nr:hypothetical protein [gamma proteobacterium endosymbiont of Lamellibrachia anaximandri]MBL3618700.1 hypothetical protein [gamma proteobacterium endosymbiont of Lamellibrachia anaximandri]
MSVKTGSIHRLLCLLAILMVSAITVADDSSLKRDGVGDTVSSLLTPDNANLLMDDYSLSLSDSYSLQIDRTLGNFEDDSVTGLGGHVFWSDPQQGLLDASASTLQWGTANVNRFGLDGKWYNSITTLSGGVEYQTGDVDNQFNLFADIGLYPFEILSIQGGAAQINGEPMGHLGFEVQPAADSMPGLTLMGSAAMGKNDHEYIFLGLRYAFGSNGRLIDRHRNNPSLLFSSRRFGTDLYSIKTEREKSSETLSSTEPGFDGVTQSKTP